MLTIRGNSILRMHYLQPSGRSSRFGRLGLISCVVMLVFCAPLNSANPEAEHASNVTRATLANGLRVIVVRDPLAPVVTTVMNYQVGSNEALPGFPGMAHAQEHMTRLFLFHLLSLHRHLFYLQSFFLMDYSEVHIILSVYFIKLSND